MKRSVIVLVILLLPATYCATFLVTACCAAQQLPAYGGAEAPKPVDPASIHAKPEPPELPPDEPKQPDKPAAASVRAGGQAADKSAQATIAPPSSSTSVRSEFEYFLSAGVLVFAMVVIALEIWVILRYNKGWGVNATRIVIVTTIIMAALFLITAGYSQEQIGPVMGLLGTIAGYVLGKSENGHKA